MSNYQLPTLFARNSDGSIQQWIIEVSGDKYRTLVGRHGGKIVESEWTTCIGKNIGKKNETSPAQQAQAEASARWEKKKKTGYTEDIGQVDTCTNYVVVMLAKHLENYEKKIDWTKGAIVQLKMNGNRAVARLENGQVVLRTREGELWVSCPHINADLVEFFNIYPDAVLDGELFNDKYRQRLNDMSSILRKRKNITPDEYENSRKIVRFYVYDGYCPSMNLGEKAPYKLRKAFLDKELEKHTLMSMTVRVKDYYVKSRAEVDEIYGKFINQGHEGVIIRFDDSPYHHGRTKLLLKHKPEMTAEGIILDLHEGSADWAGTAKTATIKWGETVFDVTFMGSYELGAERLKNPSDWVGKKVTFKYNDLSGLGVPNFARIDPLNCFSADR